ncbi:MAG: FxLYD domain-containing protein [Anaerolineae bacterium]
MLSWQPVHRAVSYRLHSDMGSGFGIYILRAEVEGNSFVDTHLRPTTAYHYRVVALKHDNERLLTNLTVTTPPQPALASIGSRMLMTLLTPTRAAVTVTPAPTPLPPDTIILGLLSASDYVDEIDGYLVIVGEVRNDSNMNVGNAVVSVVLYDAQGERKGEIEGKPVLSTLAPGERSPFIIKMERPSSEVHYSVRATARAKSKFHTSSTPMVHVSSSRRFEDDIGLYHIAGVVKNKGTRYVAQARVVVILYNRGGEVVNVGFGYPKPAALAPGEYADFDVTFTYYPKVVRHTVLILAD